jgi:hypothetical protein
MATCTPACSACYIHVDIRTLNVLTFDLWEVQEPQLKVNVPSGTIAVTGLKSLEACVFINCESSHRTETSSCAVSNSVETNVYSLISLASQLQSSARFSSSKKTVTTSEHSATCSRNKNRVCRERSSGECKLCLGQNWENVDLERSVLP